MQQKDNNVRLFIAVDLPQEVKKEINRMKARLFKAVHDFSIFSDFVKLLM